MTDAIVIAVVLIVVALAGGYIYKAKKSGKKCIGCPDGCSCSAKEQGGCCCGCGSTTAKKK